MNEEEKERLIKKDIASIENRVRHAFNQGYEMGLKERKNTCEDAISRQAAIDAVDNVIADYIPILLGRYEALPLEMALAINRLPSVKPQYTDAEIQKMQDLEQAEIEKAYELGKAVQPKTGHCKECKYFEYDSMAKVDGIPLIVAHEICSKWGDGCKTKEDGYCFLFEPREEEE